MSVKGPSDFERMPPEIKKLVIDCLSPEDLAISSASAVIFNKLISNNQLWVQIANKYNVALINPKNAKKEFIQHYEDTKAVNNVLLQCFPDELSAEFAKTKDPFALAKVLVEAIYTHKKNEHLLMATDGLLSLIGTTDAQNPATQDEIDATALLLRCGVARTGTDFVNWMENTVQHAAENNIDIFEVVLPLEAQLNPDIPARLLKFAIEDGKTDYARIILEQGYTPFDDELLTTLNWAQILTKDPDDRMALNALLDHADGVIKLMDIQGENYASLSKAVKALRASLNTDDTDK